MNGKNLGLKRDLSRYTFDADDFCCEGVFDTENSMLLVRIEPNVSLFSKHFLSFDVLISDRVYRFELKSIVYVLRLEFGILISNLIKIDAFNSIRSRPQEIFPAQIIRHSISPQEL